MSPLSKAVLVNRDVTPPLGVPVMFNPPEYQLSRANRYAEVSVPGLGSSPVEFVRGYAQTLTTSLFFDTSDTGVNVRAYTSLVVALTTPVPHTHKPPRLLFLWGSLVFPCVLEQVTQKFTMFDPAGLPLRAELSVTLRGDDTIETLLKEIPLESSDKVKTRVLKAGETLQSVSASEYGDSRKWRAIAEASGIGRPLHLRPGQVLTIPILTEDA